MLTDVKAPIGIVAPMERSELSVRPASPKRVAFCRKKGFVPNGEIREAKDMQTIRMERRGAL